MDSVLDMLVQQIINFSNPERIILFGSRANQKERPYSDYDLLIIIKDGQNPREVTRNLYRNIHGVTIPFDLIVTTHSGLETHKSNPGLIYQQALHQGIEVYAA